MGCQSVFLAFVALSILVTVFPSVLGQPRSPPLAAALSLMRAQQQREAAANAAQQSRQESRAPVSPSPNGFVALPKNWFFPVQSLDYGDAEESLSSDDESALQNMGVKRDLNSNGQRTAYYSRVYKGGPYSQLRKLNSPYSFFRLMGK